MTGFLASFAHDAAHLKRPHEAAKAMNECVHFLPQLSLIALRMARLIRFAARLFWVRTVGQKNGCSGAFLVPYSTR